MLNIVVKLLNDVKDYASKYFQKTKDQKAFYEEGKLTLEEVMPFPEDHMDNCGREVVLQSDVSQYKKQIISEIKKAKVKGDNKRIGWMYQVLANIETITEQIYDQHSKDAEGRDLVDKEFYLTHKTVRTLDDIVHKDGDYAQYLTQNAQDFVPYPEDKIQQVVSTVYDGLTAPRSELTSLLRRYKPEPSHSYFAGEGKTNLRRFLEYIKGDKEDYVKDIIRTEIKKYDETSVYNPNIVDALEKRTISGIKRKLNEMAKENYETRAEFIAFGAIGI